MGVEEGIKTFRGVLDLEFVLNFSASKDLDDLVLQLLENIGFEQPKDNDERTDQDKQAVVEGSEEVIVFESVEFVLQKLDAQIEVDEDTDHHEEVEDHVGDVSLQNLLLEVLVGFFLTNSFQHHTLRNDCRHEDEHH